MRAWSQWVIGAAAAAAATFAGAADACTNQQALVCLTQFPGSVQHFNQDTGRCECVEYSSEPRRVTNARRGDVGLVPIFTERGSPVVRAALAAVGQNHRHSVMFLNNGRHLRHSTLAEDAISPVYMPHFHLNGEQLRNGAPGIVTDTTDEAYANGNLDSVGLVLKPSDAPVACLIGQPCVTERDRFVAAADLAAQTFGAYKLSDYTDLDSMGLPWIPGVLGLDQRGSHCSGFLRFLFEEQGYSIPLVQYPEAVRQAAAEDIFDEAREMITDALSARNGLAAYPNGPTNGANQITNCFADLGCGNYSDDWRDNRVGVGPGASVSPDNLLPRNFTLGGAGTYEWDGASRAAGAAVANAAGNTSTPFAVIEIQQMEGGLVQNVVHVF